jgi:hypothetical protein
MATKSLLYALEMEDVHVWMLEKWKDRKKVIADARARNSRRLSWSLALLFGVTALLLIMQDVKYKYFSAVFESVGALAVIGCLLYTICALTEGVRGYDLEFLEATKKLQDVLAYPNAIDHFDRMRELAVNDLVELHYRVCLNERDKDNLPANQEAHLLRTKFIENHGLFSQFELVDDNPRKYRDRAIEKFSREQREKAEFVAPMVIAHDYLDELGSTDSPSGGGMPG